MNDFLIFGSSGLTGSLFLNLVKKKNLSYHLYLREFIDSEDLSNQTIFDFENIPQFPRSTVLVICIGYPLKFLELIYMKEEVREKFKKTDFDLISKIAKNASDQGIREIAIISAVGSNPLSFNYYLKIKGLIEKEILSLDFKKIIFVKPSHLLGSRDASRIDIWVKLVEFFGEYFGFLFIGPLRKFKNIEASAVSTELLKVIQRKDTNLPFLIETYEKS
tara:strand:+ start:355 stop:1011 length:657 start_codon:yes stop_codon:yes gene_type:complete